MRSYKHSGDAGDIVYSLAAVRCTGGGTYYLGRRNDTRVPMNFAAMRNIAPLLESQPYVRLVEIWRDEPVRYDFDRIRTLQMRHENLARCHLRLFGLPEIEVESKWLEVTPTLFNGVIFNRTARWHNDLFPWKRIRDRYRSAIFVGTEIEHANFERQFGRVFHYRTQNLLQLASVIAGCSLFVGNQSTPYAIAEGLKRRVIQETCPTVPNCIFPREGAKFVAFDGKNLELPDV